MQRVRQLHPVLPVQPEPCHDKFTLFQTAEDMVDSHNAGVLFLGGDKVRVRTFGEPKDYDLSGKMTCPPIWRS